MASEEKLVQVIVPEDQDFTILEDGARPVITLSGEEYQFVRGDEVLLCLPSSRSKEGPYWINEATHEKPGLTDRGNYYSLCDEDGEPVKGGELFLEEHLELL